MPAFGGPLRWVRGKIVTANWRAISATLALSLLVGLLQLQVLYPLHKTMDLSSSDEAVYMGQGASFLHDGNLGPLSGSPLYALLYSFLVAAVGRVDSIFLAQYVIKTFVSLALYCFLSANLRSRLLASLLAMVWIVASVNVYPGIIVNHTALGLFLLALICIEKRQALALMLLCMCSLARLDYLFALIAFAVYVLWKTVKLIVGRRSSTDLGGAAKSKRGWEYAAASTIAVLVIYILVHVDNFNLGGRRTWFAFNQHYALLQVERGRFNLRDPYVDYNIVMQADFPGATSLRQALETNPRRFLGNIARNVPRLGEAVLWTVSVPYPGPNFWASGGPDQRAPLLRMMYGVIAGFFITTVSLASFEREFAKGLRTAFRRKKLLVYAVIMSLPALFPTLLVYPSPRYALIMVPFLLFLPGLVCQEALGVIPAQRFSRRVLLVLNLLFVLVIEMSPKPFSVKNPSRPKLAEISELSQLWPNERLTLMGIGSTWYMAYLGGDKVAPIEPFGTFGGGLVGEARQDQAGDLGALIRRYDPDVVLVNDDLVGSPNFHIPTLSALDSISWRRCTIGTDSFYFKAGKVDTRFPCFSS